MNHESITTQNPIDKHHTASAQAARVWTGPTAQVVQQIFSSIAPRYDLTNHVLSLGIHQLWRKKMVKNIPFSKTLQLLDCATGTGDVIFTAWRYLKSQEPFQGRLIGVDFCQPMLQVARHKASKRNVPAEFLESDVTHLPFPNNSFHVVSIAFGIRNVENPHRAIQEMSRVLKPGGLLLILEFGQIKQGGIFKYIYDWYSQKWLPTLGGLLTKNQNAYQYLERSSKQFPSQEEFVQILRKEPALTNFATKSLTGGIAYLYSANKT
ncbi:MAG: bifunctional demethylmenaquinone methyltransferase/2-methoxy-6-polyprenyl-1,4-benzoquinol methylase UbiE [Bdellovibrionaceae bacterium]|nr:bifunctional demethylmenaquinone methyltransferase/2-methoxy-6-polyprenyl-1,4-benzoquinol methylase UbiE [Pseudobdellovibrionaceae bacterium]MDW8189722.1 bifunctional demethylmenaquinone methyltransferase/2-methoxy-6-polyprenyl-1,4-benzoquinol methylase UbiE [Pseudobdellovibrionaceae bacterium]